MSIIVDDLEDKCRQTTRDMKRGPLDLTPVTFVGREIALILDQIDKIRDREKALMRRLQARRLSIGTQIMNIDSRTDLVPNWLERTRLKNEFTQMLDKIENQI
jgi:hypothetical protein